MGTNEQVDHWELAALIEEELRAQIGIGRLGEIDPAATEIAATASLLADVIQRVYRLERRPQKPAM